MPSITIGLPECGFLEDLPDVTFTDITAVAYVTVKLDNVTLLSNIRLTPDKQNRIVIYARPMIRSLVSLTKPAAFETLIPMLQVQLRIGSTIFSTSGAVIPGGTGKAGTINELWYAKNFLTWQPQIIETTRQQPQWLAYTPTSIYSQNQIASRLYTKDGRIFDKTLRTDTGSTALYFRQLQTDFSHLWGAECEAQELTPIAYDVYGNDSKTRTLYTQRYILRPERYNDVCFGFENTLGGFDTLMLEGKQTFQPEGDITTFKTGSTEKELANDFTSIWEANTGRLETERMANQFLDFLKSTNRHVLHRGMWRRIIVTEYKVKHYPGESNAYTFKYHLAERNERRYCERVELPDVELPTKFFSEI